MAYRKPERCFSFSDLAVEKHADKNHFMALLKQLNKTIDQPAPGSFHLFKVPLPFV